MRPGVVMLAIVTVHVLITVHAATKHGTAAAKIAEAHVQAEATASLDAAQALSSLGEEAKTQGFFSALQTSGSFTMSQAGGFEEESEDLRGLGEENGEESTENCATGGAFSDTQAAEAVTGTALNCNTADQFTAGNKAACQASGCLRTLKTNLGVKPRHEAFTTYCTQCKPGYAFSITRTGSGGCSPYVTTPQIRTTMICGSKPFTNSISTKFAIGKVVLMFQLHPNAAVKSHFASVAAGPGKLYASVARCTFRKETICNGLSCTSKKQVRCLEVCKLDKFKNANNVIDPSYKLCDENKCAGDYGKLACREVAMMA